jgi:UDPglucose--hexose-1-phosphate uridylyltransferase
MPELRRDPLLNRWVVIAPERARRPQHFPEVDTASEKLDPAHDPFAEGNERFTTSEIYAIRPDGGEPNGPGWTLRVVPNKYPALQVDGHWNEPLSDGLYDHASSTGAHEVVIETPDSHLQFAELSVERIVYLLQTYRMRMEDLYRDQRIVQVLPFKNHGREAGATLPHSHSQILGLPFVSPTLRTQLQSLQSHWIQHKRSMFEDIIDGELKTGERVVQQDDHELAFCPYASGFPFEVIVLPKLHSPDYVTATDEQLLSLAKSIKSILLKWERVLGKVAYNFVLHSAPSSNSFIKVRDEFPDLDSYYCWHIQMFPRITRQAGFEWGSGTHINIVAPEEAAAALREVDVTL